jgi:hypothetical protein
MPTVPVELGHEVSFAPHLLCAEPPANFLELKQKQSGIRDMSFDDGDANSEDGEELPQVHESTAYDHNESQLVRPSNFQRGPMTFTSHFRAFFHSSIIIGAISGICLGRK